MIFRKKGKVFRIKHFLSKKNNIIFNIFFSDEGFKGTIVYPSLKSLHQCSLKITLTVTETFIHLFLLLLQVDPMVQDTWDSARKITCDWQSKLEKMVTFAPFGVADILQVAEVKFAGSGDNVRTRMEIQFGRGPFAPPLEGLTKIGDELTVVVYAEDGGAGYDMMVKNCYAYDSINFKRANKIRLLNDHGCLYRPHQMEYFQRTFDTRNSGADIVAFARMNAFKFPDKMDVFLSCELELCKGGCDTHCEMDDYPIDIIERLDNTPSSRQLPETEAVPATTFRSQPELKKILKGVKRRRKPKDFSVQKMVDDARDLLDVPGTLSPELLQLLEDIGASEADGDPTALPQRTERPIEATSPLSPSVSLDSNKMSFSTIFAGTHTVSDTMPATIINNDERFKPSQLLSASIDQTSPLSDSISSFSKGASGSNVFPPRVNLENLSSKLTSSLKEQEQTLSGPFFSIPTSNSGSSQIIHFPADNNINNGNNNFNNQINSISDNIDAIDFNINTLQQQLQSDGRSDSAQQSNVIEGGFKPLQSASPNLQSTSLIFTSPRSVELLQQKLSENPNVPKKVLLKIVDEPSDDRLSRNIISRPRFGSRISRSQRFQLLQGARKRRDALEIENVFSKETVNVVKGFQVVSASDLAFNADQQQGQSKKSESLDFESEICFTETSFYSGLLVLCSLILLSGIVSVCSIKKVRKYQNDRSKKFFFGSTVLDSYQ